MSPPPHCGPAMATKKRSRLEGSRRLIPPAPGRTPAFLLATVRADHGDLVPVTATVVVLVAVEDAILVAIDADAHPRARRRAGVGQLAASPRGGLPQAGIGDRRVVPPVADEQARSGVVEIPFFAVLAPALDHQVALPRPGAIDQQVDPRSGHGAVVWRERRLLPDDGRQVAVESEHEGFDLAFLELAGRSWHEPAGSRRRLLEARSVGNGADEVENRRQAPVVIETEAADLIALEGVVAGVDRRARHSEHADLLVLVAEVRRLEALRSAVDGIAAVGAEEAWSGHALVRVGMRIELVARLAGAFRGEVGHVVEEEIPSHLLVRS